MNTTSTHDVAVRLVIEIVVFKVCPVLVAKAIAVEEPKFVAAGLQNPALAPSGTGLAGRIRVVATSGFVVKITNPPSESAARAPVPKVLAPVIAPTTFAIELRTVLAQSQEPGPPGP